MNNIYINIYMIIFIKCIKVKMMEVNKVSYAVDYPEDIKVIENELNNI